MKKFIDIVFSRKVGIAIALIAIFHNIVAHNFEAAFWAFLFASEVGLHVLADHLRAKNPRTA